MLEKYGAHILYFPNSALPLAGGGDITWFDNKNRPGPFWAGVSRGWAIPELDRFKQRNNEAQALLLILSSKLKNE